MANFDDGVKSFVRTTARVFINFPIDWRDNAEIACKHCKFFTVTTRKCVLTGEVVPFPEKYVGHDCPLEIIEDGEAEENV